MHQQYQRPKPQQKAQQPGPQVQEPRVSSSASQIPIPAAFSRRKSAILDHLAVPDDEYTDLSPKGSVDVAIRDLIDEINALDGFVTTSSCAGRVSVFLEGRRGRIGDEGGELPSHALAVVGGEGEGEGDDDDDDVGGDGDDDGALVERSAAAGASTSSLGRAEAAQTVAGVGGKGGGGRWLFVSHEPVETHGKLDCEPNIVAALLGIQEPIFDGREGSSAEDMSGVGSRLIHFKFEPMILHVLTASPHHAQVILRCGLQAGFRESGAINLVPSPKESSATPIVAIRSMGLGFESLIGRETNGIKHCTVSEEYLKALVKIANERFMENARRIGRFRGYLKAAAAAAAAGAAGALRKTGRKGEDGGEWEGADVRRERKRAEGLRKAEEVRKMKEQQRRGQGEEGLVLLGHSEHT